jgi:tRNA pseudouridine38-40 synthase
MATYKSIIAYDGTDFQGFQRQAEGLRTVQGVIENALHDLGWRERSITAAGRTDAGVHARGQVIAFALDWRHEINSLSRALNANLPPDVAVRQTEVAPQGFHPRFSAQVRRYSYTVICAPVRDPLRERFAWRIWPEPELEAMEAAAIMLVGRYDFAAFGQAPSRDGHTIREVFRAHWSRKRDVIMFEIEANAFLHHMVRRLVGAMIEVGSDRVNANEIRALLVDPKLRWEGRIAAAQGLCLEKVIYE